MAGRGASAAFLTEIAKPANQPVHLFEAHFDDGVIRNTDAYRTLTWGGNTYLANGHFMQFSGIQESAALKVSECDIALSGVDQVWISAVLAKQYIDRRLVIYKAMLSAGTDAVIVDPVPIFDGRMDAPAITENPDDGKCIVAIHAASHWVDFERKPGRHTNHEEQQIHFPGDRGFEYAAQLTKEIKWGVA